jgi:hypothetical protein
LYRCVALYELCDRLNAPSRWEHLGASHLRLVIGLPPGAQEKLLATANARRWTVKVLHRQVLSEKTARITRGGRRPQPLIMRGLISVRKNLTDYHDAINHIGKLSRNELEQSMLLVEETRSCLDGLSRSLQAAMGLSSDGAHDDPALAPD